MIDGIVKIGAAFLKIAEIKLSRKYKEKWLELQNKYFKEKSQSPVDMARLDNIERELHLLNTAMADEILGNKHE